MNARNPASGIYEIRNTLNNKVYVGSAKRFNFRWNTHLSLLRKGSHHSPHLQAAWNKYGEAAFAFRALLICSVENLVMYEQIVIDAYRASDRGHGYNARPVAESMLGYKHTPEARKKMVEANTGRVSSPATRALLSRQRTGRKMPDWFPASVSKRMQGFQHSAATKAVISAKSIGRPVTLRTREKKAKITFEQVQTIKTRAAAGATQAQLAAEFCLNQSSISLIVSGKRWANLPSTHLEISNDKTLDAAA